MFIGHPPELWKTHAALGRLHEAHGDAEAATLAYRAARDVIDRVTGGLKDSGLAAALDRSPLVVAVRDGAR